MKALVLEDVARFAVREAPAPVMGVRDVLIRIGAVGICGTDLHIFNGFANYHRDQHGYQIPLTKAPQILGHEFCGVVEAVGKDVTKFNPGDRVIADQVLNCHSQAPRCHSASIARPATRTSARIWMKWESRGCPGPLPIS